MAQRRALMVRGGWPGHEPAESVAAVRPLLEARDVDVTVSDSLDSYLDPGLGEFDLIVQCWTMGRITIEQVTGLRAAVASGTGFAGWHGGIADSFRSREEYLQLVGGQYVAHPDGFVTYRIDIVDDPGLPGAGITDGLGPSFEIETEQYWVITDDYNDVLATTTIRPGPHTPWRRPVTCPAVWTRQWGAGRVFVSTLGHSAAELEIPVVRRLIDRGMAWAAR